MAGECEGGMTGLSCARWRYSGAGMQQPMRNGGQALFARAAGGCVQAARAMPAPNHQATHPPPPACCCTCIAGTTHRVSAGKPRPSRFAG